MARLALFLAAFGVAFGLAGAGYAADSGAKEFEVGRRLYFEEKFREAQDRFEQAVSLDPENSRYRLWLGMTFGRRAEGMSGLRKLAAIGLAKRTGAEFKRAVELDGSDLEALEALLQFHLEGPSMVGGDKETAKELCGRIEEVDESSGAAAWAKYYEFRRQFDRAGEYHALARRLDPADAVHTMGHAAFLAKRGSFDESYELIDQALAQDPEDPVLWFAAADIWIKSKHRSEYPRARQLLQQYAESPSRPVDAEPASVARKLLGKL